MMFTKSEHIITQVAGLSSPVSTVYARNAWDYDPPFGAQELPAFQDSGFPTEARVNILATGYSDELLRLENLLIFFLWLVMNKS